MQKICVIGLGYIGLPTAIILAKQGFEVVGFDIDQNKVKSINQKDPVIQEPEIYPRLVDVMDNNQFKATATIESADCFIIAVPTPFKEQKKADLSYVWNAVNTLIPVLKKNNSIILESTIPVGTTNKVADYVAKKTGLQAGSDFFVAHCPERVLPGKIFHELIHNARIIGGINDLSCDIIARLYKSFVLGNLYITHAKTAEMVKLIENSSRDVAIAFANQVAAMGYEMGINPFEVIELANKHPRVNILKPSCGVGGHCIAVDPWFLIESFPASTRLLKAARMINDEKPLTVVAMIRASINEWQKYNEGKPNVLVLGLTYKENIDDLRESPALSIARKLDKYSDMHLLVCEPNLKKEKLEQLFPQIVTSVEQGVEKADIIVCLVAHQQFQCLRSLSLKNKRVLDFCGLLHKTSTMIYASDLKEESMIMQLKR